MAVITDEQRANLLSNTRFKNLAKMAVQNTAGTMSANNGDVTPGGISRVEWAKQRYIAYGIKQHPNSQDYETWYVQMAGFLKDQDVWDTDEDTTINAIAFASLAEQTFSLRAQNVDF